MGLGRGPIFEKAGDWFSEKRPRGRNAVSRLGLWFIEIPAGIRDVIQARFVA